ncbi:MAG TPA: hypothetical protein VEB00_02045 [Clostridia bacterium]|nr:hypothetical protein [Clostridia bacterium]
MSFHRNTKLLADLQLVRTDARVGFYDVADDCIVEKGNATKCVTRPDDIRDGSAWTLSVCSVSHINHPQKECIYIIFHRGG